MDEKAYGLTAAALAMLSQLYTDRPWSEALDHVRRVASRLRPEHVLQIMDAHFGERTIGQLSDIELEELATIIEAASAPQRSV